MYKSAVVAACISCVSPALAADVASGWASATLSISNLQVAPGLDVVWGPGVAIEGDPVVMGNGTGGASASFSFPTGNSFQARATNWANAGAPPISAYGSYSAVYTDGAPLFNIYNPTAIPLEISFSAMANADLHANANGQAGAYVYGFASIAAYSLEVSGAPLFVLRADDQYYVGSLFGQPTGPRSSNILVSDSFSFMLPPGAEFWGSAWVSAAAFARAEAIPEPGTWAMLIVGFGLVGAGLRRRRQLEAIADERAGNRLPGHRQV